MHKSLAQSSRCAFSYVLLCRLHILSREPFFFHARKGECHTDKAESNQSEADVEHEDHHFGIRDERSMAGVWYDDGQRMWIWSSRSTAERSRSIP